MSDLTPERHIIQQEETAAQAAVSESTMSRMGETIDFANTFHVVPPHWCVSGPYNRGVPPYFVDGLRSYPFNFDLLDVKLSSGTNTGVSGTFEVDILWRAENTGSFASIFTTTPKFNGGSGIQSSCRVGSAPAGFTAPVLAKTTFNAHDQLICKVLQVPVGPTVEGFGVELIFRPR